MPWAARLRLIATPAWPPPITGTSVCSFRHSYGAELPWSQSVVTVTSTGTPLVRTFEYGRSRLRLATFFSITSASASPAIV